MVNSPARPPSIAVCRARPFSGDGGSRRPSNVTGQLEQVTAGHARHWSDTTGRAEAAPPAIAKWAIIPSRTEMEAPLPTRPPAFSDGVMHAARRVLIRSVNGCASSVSATLRVRRPAWAHGATLDPAGSTSDTVIPCHTWDWPGHRRLPARTNNGQASRDQHLLARRTRRP